LHHAISGFSNLVKNATFKLMQYQDKPKAAIYECKGSSNRISCEIVGVAYDFG
jgi:hypothetical protein